MKHKALTNKQDELRHLLTDPRLTAYFNIKLVKDNLYDPKELPGGGDWWPKDIEVVSVFEDAGLKMHRLKLANLQVRNILPMRYDWKYSEAESPKNPVKVRLHNDHFKVKVSQTKSTENEWLVRVDENEGHTPTSQPGCTHEFSYLIRLRFRSKPVNQKTKHYRLLQLLQSDELDAYYSWRVTRDTTGVSLSVGGCNLQQEKLVVSMERAPFSDCYTFNLKDGTRADLLPLCAGNKHCSLRPTRKELTPNMWQVNLREQFGPETIHSVHFLRFAPVQRQLKAAK